MNPLKLAFTCGLVVVLTALTLHAQDRRRAARLPAGVTAEFDVEYGDAGGEALMLDLYRPAGKAEGPLPAVVWIHGGGWRSGDKNNVANAIALTARGYVLASINYRLSGVAPFPAAVEDCKRAVRWLRSQAGRLGVDPGRIGVWGSSAGGHLSLMVGCADESAGLEGKGEEGVSSRVRAVCSWFGPADFTSRAGRSGRAGDIIRQFLGGGPEEIPDTYALASPLTHVTADDPPVLFVHGDRDTLVPLSHSEVMLAALKKAGVEATLVVVKNGGHGFRPEDDSIEPDYDRIREECVSFFDRHLKGAAGE